MTLRILHLPKEVTAMVDIRHSYSSPEITLFSFRISANLITPLTRSTNICVGMKHTEDQNKNSVIKWPQLCAVLKHILGFLKNSCLTRCDIFCIALQSHLRYCLLVTVDKLRAFHVACDHNFWLSCTCFLKATRSSRVKSHYIYGSTLSKYYKCKITYV